MTAGEEAPQPPSWDESLEILRQLPSLPIEARRDGIERLVRNPSPEIREQAFRIGAAILPDSRLTQFLRCDADAVLRNAGAEIFRLRGDRSLSVVIGLLRDPDPDVVLQAVLILDRLRNLRALEPLHKTLVHSDPNVQQEAILAIGRLGDARSIEHLLPFLDADPWVQLAAIQALGDLRAPESIPHLCARLADPLVGSLVAEALAKIGGPVVFQALAEHWLAAGLESEEMPGLLAHVLEGLTERPGVLAGGLIEALGAKLSGPSEPAREAAARCLLVLGPGDWDDAALAVLARSEGSTDALAPALFRRPDLIGRLLLAEPTESRSWGLQLAARFPRSVPAGVFLRAVAEAGERPELMPALARSLEQLRLPGVAGALLDLYLRLEEDARSVLVPALQIQGAALREALALNAQAGKVDRLVLCCLSGLPPAEIVEPLLGLPPADLAVAVARLISVGSVVSRLPWNSWLEDAPELFEGLAAEAAGRHRLRDLLPALRARVAVAPSTEVVRALGELADRGAVPMLLDLYGRDPRLRPQILDSLGRIGGPEVRQALREQAEAAGSGPEARMVYRALAACAGPDDDVLFRAAAAHSDWHVRLTAIDALAQYGDSESRAVLARLTADPVQAVAHRALAALAG